MVKLIRPTPEEWATLKELGLLDAGEAVVLSPEMAERSGYSDDVLQWLAGFYDIAPGDYDVMFDVVQLPTCQFFAPLEDDTPYRTALDT